MLDAIKQLGKIGIVPVIKIDDAAKAVPLAGAMKKGGIPCAEITFRTAAGEAAIQNISRNLPDVLVGAGTILTVGQAEKAAGAGAKFIVTPGFNPEVVTYCLENNIPVIPGCSSPSDIERAIGYGLHTVKFFPAEQSGGLAFIQAVSAPYGNVKFMPTGGINSGNLARYISNDKVAACGGSWMAPAEFIDAERYDEITALCEEAVKTMLGFSVHHVGINSADDSEARQTAGALGALFGFPVTEHEANLFAGSGIEIMKHSLSGKNGHIAIGTNSVDKAVHYLRQKGISFREGTERYNDSGNLRFIYLEEEFGGFAIHLIKS